jgi:hypothetical protein
MFSGKVSVSSRAMYRLGIIIGRALLQCLPKILTPVYRQAFKSRLAISLPKDFHPQLSSSSKVFEASGTYFVASHKAIASFHNFVKVRILAQYRTKTRVGKRSPL